MSTSSYLLWCMTSSHDNPSSPQSGMYCIAGYLRIFSFFLWSTPELQKFPLRKILIMTCGCTVPCHSAQDVARLASTIQLASSCRWHSKSERPIMPVLSLSLLSPKVWSYLLSRRGELVTKYWNMNGVWAVSPLLDLFSWLCLYVHSYCIVGYIMNIDRSLVATKFKTTKITSGVLA